MTVEIAAKAARYVSKYGKKWTARQTALFFVAVARLLEPAHPGAQEEDR